jgi:hypothetical protein
MADWPIKNADDVAQALDWLRRRMNGAGLVLVAIGPNSVAYSIDVGLSVKDAVQLVETQIEDGTLERGLVECKRSKVTRGYQRREG